MSSPANWRGALRLACAFALVAAQPLSSQVAVQLTGGATHSGILVKDGVLLTKIGPAIAPTIGVAVAIPTGKGPYRIRLQADISRSKLKVDADGQADQLGTLTTIDLLVMAEGPVTRALRWQAGGGTLLYRPSANQGVFLDGPTSRWVVAGGLIFWHALTPRLTLLANGRVDVHSFQTPTLRARNYAGSQGVRRIALQIGIERKF